VVVVPAAVGPHDGSGTYPGCTRDGAGDRTPLRLLDEAGQYACYGRVGGCLITGNEDGVKRCAVNVLYSLQHLGENPEHR
jgi:hypothetical protein